MNNDKQPDNPKNIDSDSTKPQNSQSKHTKHEKQRSQKSHSELQHSTSTKSSKSESAPNNPTKPKKTQPKRVSKYVIVGITLTIINFSIYTFFNRVVINNINLLWLVSLISCTITTFFGYLLHSNITWRERHPGKTGVIKFLVWNLFSSLAISPFFTWLFGFIKPLYQFAYTISSNLHLPFDYDFVESTAIFCLTSFVVMVLNFLFYDHIVFKSKESPNKKSSK